MHILIHVLVLAVSVLITWKIAHSIGFNRGKNFYEILYSAQAADMDMAEDSMNNVKKTFNIISPANDNEVQ